MELTSYEINDISHRFTQIKSELAKLRAITLVEEFKHISGKTVIATCIIPFKYELGQCGGYVNHATISTINPDLEHGWLKLSKQSSPRYKSISIDMLLTLPLWDDSMLSLKCIVKS